MRYCNIFILIQKMINKEAADTAHLAPTAIDIEYKFYEWCPDPIAIGL